MNTGTTEPLKLILISIPAAEEFDRIHKDDDGYSGSTITHVEDFALWAWGVETRKVLQTKFMLCPEDGKLQIHSPTCHQQCIIPPLNAMTAAAAALDENTAVLGQLAKSISRQTEETERMNHHLAREDIERRREREESKKHRLKSCIL